jgi:hypothetical protein
VKGGEKIRNTIDVQDLPEEHIKLVQEFIEFLRQKNEKKKARIEGKEKIVFARWPLGVKGTLTRSEIYEHF